MYNKSGDNMKIAIASDHRGFELKEYLKKHIKEYDLIDLGTNTKSSGDYPDYAFKLGEYIVKNNCLGIVMCGSGIGISIACNKVKGVRCAKVDCIKDAIYTKKDNNANVIALSERIKPDRAVKIVKSFIETEFSKEERHIRRINKINEYEKSN